MNNLLQVILLQVIFSNDAIAGPVSSCYYLLWLKVIFVVSFSLFFCVYLQ